MEFWRRPSIWVLGLAVGLAAACGDDDGDSARFGGNVEQVFNETADVGPIEPRYAWATDWVIPRAFAQTSCSEVTVLACVRCPQSGSGPRRTCSAVNQSSCNFSVSPSIDGDTFGCEVFFVDAGDDLEFDSESAQADLINELEPMCPGGVATISNVAIDFNSGEATAESVEQDNNCGPNSPYYEYASAPLEPAPSRWLAMLFGVGVVGLLLPVRRRR